MIINLLIKIQNQISTTLFQISIHQILCYKSLLFLKLPSYLFLCTILFLIFSLTNTLFDLVLNCLLYYLIISHVFSSFHEVCHYLELLLRLFKLAVALVIENSHHNFWHVLVQLLNLIGGVHDCLLIYFLFQDQHVHICFYFVDVVYILNLAKMRLICRYLVEVITVFDYLLYYALFICWVVILVVFAFRLGLYSFFIASPAQSGGLQGSRAWICCQIEELARASKARR